MAIEKKAKLTSIEGLDPAVKYKRGAFVRGAEGDNLWREQMAIYAGTIRNNIVADADYLCAMWADKRAAKATEKAAKHAAKAQAQE